MTLNESISIYRKAQVQAADGSLSQTRTLVCAIYAVVRPMTGSERASSDNTEAYATHRFDVHYRTDILESDILVWKSTDYNIKFISSPSAQDKYMYIDATRGGAM